MTYGVREATHKECSYYDADGHYCEVWCSDDVVDEYTCLNDPDLEE